MIASLFYTTKSIHVEALLNFIIQPIYEIILTLSLPELTTLYTLT